MLLSSLQKWQVVVTQNIRDENHRKPPASVVALELQNVLHHLPADKILYILYTLMPETHTESKHTSVFLLSNEFFLKVTFLANENARLWPAMLF